MYSDQAFVLHKIKYKNSSEIVKLLTPNEGRIDAVARGSCRPKSLFRGQLQPFIETTVSYRGKHDLKTLIQAEQQDALPIIDYPHQVAMLYCNELLLLLNMDVDVATEIYPRYKSALKKLSQNKEMARILRGFEWQLCCLSGYRLTLDNDLDDGTGILFHPDQGLISGHGKSACDAATFKQFINHAELSDSQVKAISRLMRPLIHHMVNGRTIRSRELLQSHYQLNL
jgi:DNA repair protein RecO (recombination protein O)